MEATLTKNKPGNPSLAKMAIPEKDARFKLINNYDYLKPVDGNTGQPLENPYPPIYIVANAGVAWDPKKQELRQWRYLHGYNTIWVDEQVKPVPTQQNILNEKNDIIFIGGFLRVDRKNVAKIQALMVNDAFDGNETQASPVPRVYEIIDENKEIKRMRNLADVAFEAESEARSLSDAQMMPIAQLYGIDTSMDEDLIRTHFINIAKSSPAKFLENVANPKYKAKYIITESLKKGLIEVRDNKLIYLENGKPFFEVNGNGDVAEQIAVMVLKNDDLAVALLEKLEEMLG